MHYVQAAHSAPRGRDVRLVILVAVAGFIFLTLPRVVGWSGNHLHKEDGSIFFADFAQRGWGSLFDVYSGYLHIGARSVVGTCSSAFPLEWLTGCISLSTAAFRVLCFVLVVPVAVAMARSSRWGVLAASAFLFMPVGQHEVLGNVTNMRWFLTAVAVWLVFSNYRSATFAVIGAVVGAVAALTDPLVLVLIPLAAARMVLGRCWGRLPAAGVLAGSVVQVLALDLGSRTGESGLATLLQDPFESLVQLVVRGPVVAVYGMTGTQAIFLGGGLALVVAALVVPMMVWLASWTRARSQPVEAASSVLLLLAGTAALAATLTFAEPTGIALTDWWSVANASRYSAVAGLLLIPSLIMSARVLFDASGWRRAIALVLIATLGLAVVADFRGDPWSTRGPEWSDSVAEARAACLDQESVRMQFTPDGVPMDWSAEVSCSALVAHPE